MGTVMKKRSRRPSRPAGRGRARVRDVSEFDQEFVVDSFGPPAKEALARWEAAKGRPGRPRVGEGAQVISVSVERQLLSRSDHLARELGLTRAALIARGLKAVLAAEGRI